MFTGIIQDVGRVVGLATRGGGRRLSVATALDAGSFELGESMAVNGVCLTVAAGGAAVRSGRLPGDAAAVNLGELRPGVPSTWRGRCGRWTVSAGHFVLGHVDGTGRLSERSVQGEFEVLRFESPEVVTRYLVEKGSVAVDGVSLTVAAAMPAGSPWR